MKKCNLCNTVYEDSYNLCPICGTRLVDIPESNGNFSKSSRDNQYSGRTNYKTPPQSQTYQFEHMEGADTVFNGALVESNTQQLYQSGWTKIIRAIFSGEPYQLSHTSFITTFRLEEHTTCGYPEKAQDITLYGKLMNVLTPGDDLTVHTRLRHGQYMARNIYSHSLGRDIKIEGNIPPGVVRVVALAVVGLVIFLLHSVLTADYAAIGSGILHFLLSLLPAAVFVWLIWYLIRRFFQH